MFFFYIERKKSYLVGVENLNVTVDILHCFIPHRHAIFKLNKMMTKKYELNWCRSSQTLLKLLIMTVLLLFSNYCAFEKFDR